MLAGDSQKGSIKAMQSQVPTFWPRTPCPAGEGSHGNLSFSEINKRNTRNTLAFFTSLPAAAIVISVVRLNYTCREVIFPKPESAGGQSISREPPAPPPPRTVPAEPRLPAGAGGQPLPHRRRRSPLGMSRLRTGSHALVSQGRTPQRALPQVPGCPSPFEGGRPATLRGAGVPPLLSSPRQPPKLRPRAGRGVLAWEGRSSSLPRLRAVFLLELN